MQPIPFIDTAKEFYDFFKSHPHKFCIGYAHQIMSDLHEGLVKPDERGRIMSPPFTDLSNIGFLADALCGVLHREIEDFVVHVVPDEDGLFERIPGELEIFAPKGQVFSVGGFGASAIVDWTWELFEDGLIPDPRE